MCYLGFLYSAICRQLLICYYSSSCNNLETGTADWFVKIMPTVELIKKNIYILRLFRQRFLRAAVAPCTHSVIPLISVDPGDDPQGLANQYLVENVIQLVSRILEFKDMYICTYMLLKQK